MKKIAYVGIDYHINACYEASCNGYAFQEGERGTPFSFTV